MALGVVDAVWAVILGDMLYEVLHLQVRRRGEHPRKNGRVSFAWFPEQGFSLGIIFKCLPMLAAQKSLKKPVHDPDPAIGLVLPARVNAFLVFPVHINVPYTHLFDI